MDGVRRQIDPTEHGFGPIDENIFAWTPEQLSSIRPLPSSLKESLDALAEDNAFLQQGGVFDDEMIEDWIDLQARRRVLRGAQPAAPIRDETLF